MRRVEEAALDVVQQMVRSKLNHDETRRVYAAIVDVWKTQICTTWAPVRRELHTCSATACQMQALTARYVVIRNPTFSDVHCIEVARSENPEEPYVDGNIAPPRAHEGCVLRGVVSDAFVCKATGLLHICNEQLCGGEKESRQGDQHARAEIGAVCRVTGVTYGGAEMVHKYWRPGPQNATSESTGMTREDTINGRMALARHRRDCNYTFGETWMDFYRGLDDIPLSLLDTSEKIRETIRTRGLKRVTLCDAQCEYKLWAFARVASLFSPARQKADLIDTARIREIVNRSVNHVINTSTRPPTILEVRAVQLNHMKKHWFPMSIALGPNGLPEKYLRRYITMYANKCYSYWVTICVETVGPGVTAAARARSLMFQDFVIACMYKFANGLYLPPEVTGTPMGAHIIRPDTTLKWLLPKQTLLENYTCSKDAVAKQDRAINTIIRQAVEVFGVPPLVLMPDASRLPHDSIDILPELSRHRDRKRK